MDRRAIRVLLLCLTGFVVMFWAQLPESQSDPAHVANLVVGAISQGQWNDFVEYVSPLPKNRSSTKSTDERRRYMRRREEQQAKRLHTLHQLFDLAHSQLKKVANDREVASSELPGEQQESGRKRFGVAMTASGESGVHDDDLPQLVLVEVQKKWYLETIIIEATNTRDHAPSS